MTRLQVWPHRTPDTTRRIELHLEKGDANQAAQTAYDSMMNGVQALLSHRLGVAPQKPDDVLSQFRVHFHDTKLFHDPFAQGKFAQYYFVAHERNGGPYDDETARQQIEEAQLFIEAAHSCYGRILEQEKSPI